MSILASVGERHEVASEIMKASPPVTVTGLVLGGITLQDWVLIATLFYTLMQAGWFVYSKFIRKASSGGGE